MKFMADNGLPLPSRIDFSCYLDLTGATYDQLLQHVLDDADATLPSLGAPRLYGAAETSLCMLGGRELATVTVTHSHRWSNAESAPAARWLLDRTWSRAPNNEEQNSAYPFTTLRTFLPPPP